MSSLSNPPSGIGPVAAGGPSGAALAYDAHGNTSRLADQALTYDDADRHVKTVLDDSSEITYVWGTGGEIVSRTSSTGQVSRFSFGLVLNGSGGFMQDSISLPGGAGPEATWTANQAATSIRSGREAPCR